MKAKITEIFKNHPEVNSIYVSTDGLTFVDKQKADKYQKTLGKGTITTENRKDYMAEKKAEK